MPDLLNTLLTTPVRGFALVLFLLFASAHAGIQLYKARTARYVAQTERHLAQTERARMRLEMPRGNHESRSDE